MDFDDWMFTKNPKHVTTDDTVALRILRECWNDAQKQQAAEIATVRRLNLVLTKNAMNRPKDCPNCNTWAENEKLRAELKTPNAIAQGREHSERPAGAEG